MHPRRFFALATAAALPALVALAPAPARAEGKIGVVDIQQAVMQTEDGRRAQTSLKKDFDKRQKEITALQDELQKAREDIERQQKILSREALNRRMEDWQRRMLDVQQRFLKHNEELQKKQAELTGPIIKKLVSVIARIAKKNGYEIIIDRPATAYARPDLDLTEQVVQMYNSGDAGDAAPEGGGDDKK
jgi:outer membrane protein